MGGWNRYLYRALSLKTLAAVSLSFLMVGCNGHVYTINKPEGVEIPEAYSLASVSKEIRCGLSSIPARPCKFEGVLAYQPTNFMEIYWTTSVLKIVLRDGKPEKSSEVERTYQGTKPATRCEPQMVVKQVVRGDYERPYQIFYAPGLLEKYTFKAEFDQGVLKSINADSTPDRGETMKNITTAVAEAAKIAATAALTGGDETVHYCSDGPVLTYIKRAEEVCPNGVCQWNKYPP